MKDFERHYKIGRYNLFKQSYKHYDRQCSVKLMSPKMYFQIKVSGPVRVTTSHNIEDEPHCYV